MIVKAWKVVDKETRAGSNGWLCRNSEVWMLRDGKDMTPEEFLDYRKSLQLSEIVPLYLNGKKVKAYRGTVGLMCFKFKKDAKQFINHYCGDDDIKKKNSAEIIRVEGEIKEHADNVYIFSGGSGIYKLANNIFFKEKGYMSPPKGTIFMKWVKVLE